MEYFVVNDIKYWVGIINMNIHYGEGKEMELLFIWNGFYESIKYEYFERKNVWRKGESSRSVMCLIIDFL